MILMLYLNNDEEKWRDKKRTHANTQKIMFKKFSLTESGERWNLKLGFYDFYGYVLSIDL